MIQLIIRFLRLEQEKEDSRILLVGYILNNTFNVSFRGYKYIHKSPTQLILLRN